MSRLWKEIKRIAKHTMSIMNNMFGRITRGTTSAFKAVGTGFATLTTFVVLASILFVIGLVALPFGVFREGDLANANNIDNKPKLTVVDNTFKKESDPNEMG